MCKETIHRNKIDHKSLDYILSYLKGRKVLVEIKNYKNYHMVITGSERVVNFYPTTSTISCNPDGKHKPFNLRGAKLETALKRVVDLANIGY